MMNLFRFLCLLSLCFFFKQKTAYEMRISDWSSDVCSSDLAVEQDLHVVDRVDRDARLADIAGNARVIAVIAAMRRQIERDRQPLLPGGEVAAVESVRFLGGGEARKIGRASCRERVCQYV